MTNNKVILDDIIVYAICGYQAVVITHDDPMTAKLVHTGSEAAQIAWFFLTANSIITSGYFSEG